MATPLITLTPAGTNCRTFDPCVSDARGRAVTTTVTITTLLAALDDSGRTWGYTLNGIPAALHAAVLAGATVPVYEVQSHAERDGKLYGAIARRTTFATLAEAEAARDKSGRAAMARNQRNFGGAQ